MVANRCSECQALLTVLLPAATERADSASILSASTAASRRLAKRSHRKVNSRLDVREGIATAMYVRPTGLSVPYALGLAMPVTPEANAVKKRDRAPSANTETTPTLTP